MGGKGSEITPAPPTSNSTTADNTMGMMLALMASQQANASLTAPSQLSLPYQIEYTDVNWSEQSSALASKAKADYELSQKRKRGQSSTVHTSPLLDEEDVSLSTSILTGK